MIDLSGKKFNRLTPIELVRKDKYYNSFWLCRCECGNECVVKSGNLTTGHTKSCGCYGKEKASEICILRNKTHGKSKTRLYNIWSNMKARCSNINNPDYKKWYGSRGIKVCDEWKDFLKFYKWSIEHGYSDELSIDRINVNGAYEPNNCRWATDKEQANNRRKKEVDLR